MAHWIIQETDNGDVEQASQRMIGSRLQVLRQYLIRNVLQPLTTRVKVLDTQGRVRKLLQL